MVNDNVLAFHIRGIYQSGLILSEHDELLTLFWKPVTPDTPLRLQICLISASALSSLALGLHTRSALLGGLSAIPWGVKLCQYLYLSQKYGQYKDDFTLQIRSLKVTFSMLKAISNEYKLRKAELNGLSSYTRKVAKELLINRMLQLLTDTGQIALDLVIFLRSALKEIGNIINIGALNFIFTIDLSADSFDFNDKSEEGVLHNYDRIYMAFIYVTSTYLCGLGLSMCKTEWKTENSEFSKVFSQLLPRHLKSVIIINKELKGKLHEIRHTSTTSHVYMVSKNIDRPIFNTIQTLRVQISTSFEITEAMHYDLMSDTDISNMGFYLDDLDLVFERIHKILKFMRRNIPKAPVAQIEQSPAVEQEEEVNGVLIKHDDNTDEFGDEEFNLSIHGSEHSEEENPMTLEYDQIVGYVKSQKSMMNELNEELRRRKFLKQGVSCNSTLVDKIRFQNCLCLKIQSGES